MTKHASRFEQNFSASDRKRLLFTINDIFNDKKGGQVYLHPIEKGSVVVSWYNTTLGLAEPCPFHDIAKLAKAVFNGELMKEDVEERCAYCLNICVQVWSSNYSS